MALDKRMKAARATRRKRANEYEHLTGLFYGGEIHGFSIVDRDQWEVHTAPGLLPIALSTADLRDKLDTGAFGAPAPGGFVKRPGHKMAWWEPHVPQLVAV